MDFKRMIFDGWTGPARVVLVGLLAYLALLVLLRVSGKRTLSKMNAFDFIVTIALGSTLASVLLSRDVALAEAVAAFGVLIGVQYAVTWLSVRVEAVDRLVKSQPTLLFYRGQMLRDVMRRERVTEGEVLAAIRELGVASTADVLAVVMETTGTLTALRHAKHAPDESTLRHVADGSGAGGDRHGARATTGGGG